LLLVITIILGMCSVFSIGCGGEARKDAYYNGDAGYAKEDFDMPEIVDSESSNESASIGGLDEAAYVNNDRKLIYTSGYTIETKNFEEDYNTIIAAVEKAGGFVPSEETWGTKPAVYGDSGRSSSLEFRIPIDTYENFLDSLEGVGSITKKNRSTDDVTTEYYDNEARIDLYEKHYDKLMDYLDKATEMSDVITIESEMTEVLYMIDALKGNKRYMDDLIELCTVRVNLNEVVEYTEVAISRDSLGDRISRAFNVVIKGLGRFFEDAIVVAIAALPILAICAVVFCAIFIPIKIARKRKRQRREKKDIS
jgi:hypothetical protein